MLTKKAPLTITKMSALAKAKYFDLTYCHRLTTEGLFVLQCGDPSATGSGNPTGWKGYKEENLPEYKANRKDSVKSPFLPMVRKYMIEELNAIESHGGEADDYIIDGIAISKGNCIVSSIDKDVLYYSPNIPLYDYRGHDEVIGEFKYISTKQSRLSRASQVVIGDSTDGIPGAKGVGKAWCDKNMHIDMTDYQFIKAIFQAYLKATNNDAVEAKRQIKLYYKVLKLYTLEEMNKL